VRHRNAVPKRLHGRFAKAIPSAVRPLIVVIMHPFIQVSLEFSDASIGFLSESYRIPRFLSSLDNPELT